MWFCKDHFEVENKQVLIVGASQGVGADLALQLYSRNSTVILVARTEHKLKYQIERIQNTAKNSQGILKYLVCDAADYKSCVSMWNEIYDTHKLDPDIIFCCAGSSIPKLFGELGENDLNGGISVNYMTALNIAHTGFKSVLEKIKDSQPKKRHIIFFSSVVSFFPFIGYAQYAAMKSAIQTLSTILRQELRPFNYRISCIFAGNFSSEGFEEEQKTKPEVTKKIEGPSNPISGEACATIIINELKKGYDTITTDTIGWVLSCSVLGILPRKWSFFQIIISFIFLIVAPIVNVFMNKDIDYFFENERRTRTLSDRPNDYQPTKKDD